MEASLNSSNRVERYDERGVGMNLVVKNMIKKYGYEGIRFTLIVDEGFEKIVPAFEEEAPLVSVKRLREWGADRLSELADIVAGQKVLLLAEPQAYGIYKLFMMLDFEHGEPEIPGCESIVLVFPVDALIAVFNVDMADDMAYRDNILERMKDGARYRLTTEAGTKLEFTARHWILLDFEVCTAPVEETVEGKLVVDGAVFFRKNDMTTGEKIVVTVEHGKVTDIKAFDEQGEKLAEEYRNMIANAVKNPKNLQLAEVGIGFCKGATVSDCFMEAEIARETCHCCFGNNLCYGGKNASDFHGDSVLVMNPRFEMIG